MLNPEYNLYERNGIAFCSSRQVAEEFGKRHDNVLRDIANLDCSNEFHLLNFEEITYEVIGNVWQNPETELLLLQHC